GSPPTEKKVHGGDSGVPLLDHQEISYKPKKLVSEFAADEGSKVNGGDAGVEINTVEIEVDNGAFSAGSEEVVVAPGIESYDVSGTEEEGRRFSKAHQVFDEMSSTQKPPDLCASAAEKQLPGGTLKSWCTKKVLEGKFVEGTKEVVSNEEQGFAGPAPKKIEILPR
ncbi:hypothetical protein U1Q18_017938, partial [Sarracenia purpurea var. burkii]